MEWNKKKTVIQSSNIDLEGRWIVRGDEFFQKEDPLRVFSKYLNIKPGDSGLSRTVNTLCEDYYMNRSVILKTLKYDSRELREEKLILQKRRVLAEQIELLNKIQSNMLPEPLDYFLVKNNYDNFQIESKEIAETEPVFVLDFIPGEILSNILNSSHNYKFYRRREEDENIQYIKNDADLNVSMVLRLAGDILLFLRGMYEKGYAYTSLSTDHIILLGDVKPRFVGIGRICPVQNDKYDCNHVNYGRQLKGYSAPEMNRANDLFGLNSSVKANIVFNLGALISRMVLSTGGFDDRVITDGAYDYGKATEDRERIKKISSKLDNLLSKMLRLDAQERLTDFNEIQSELMFLSGDAIREKKPKIDKRMHSGMVVRILLDKGFGFISDNECYDVFIPPKFLTTLYTLSVGDTVYYHVWMNSEGQYRVTEFVDPPQKPRTDIVYPRFVPKPEPIVIKPKPKPQPQPKPQPEPKSQPTPDKTKKKDAELNKSTAETTQKNKLSKWILIVFFSIMAILLYYAFKELKADQARTELHEESATEATQDIIEEETKEIEEVSKEYIKIIVKDGNVRMGPGTDYEVIDLVHEDEIYEYTGKTETPESKPWYEIYLDDDRTSTGWISSIVGEIEEGYDPDKGE